MMLLVPHLFSCRGVGKGHRAKQVLGLSMQELCSCRAKQPDVQSEVVENSSDLDALFDIWLSDVKTSKSKACLAHFRLALSVRSQAFVQSVSLLISRIGCAWHDGELQIFQEHFATSAWTAWKSTGNSSTLAILSYHYSF